MFEIIYKKNLGLVFNCCEGRRAVLTNNNSLNDCLIFNDLSKMDSIERVLQIEFQFGK